MSEPLPDRLYFYNRTAGVVLSIDETADVEPHCEYFLDPELTKPLLPDSTGVVAWVGVDRICVDGYVIDGVDSKQYQRIRTLSLSQRRKFLQVLIKIRKGYLAQPLPLRPW